MSRQYRIVNPEATDAEVEQLVESGETQIFSQAVIPPLLSLHDRHHWPFTSFSRAEEAEKQTQSMQP